MAGLFTAKPCKASMRANVKTAELQISRRAMLSSLSLLLELALLLLNRTIVILLFLRDEEGIGVILESMS